MDTNPASTTCQQRRYTIVATNTTIRGVANSLSYVPGVSLDLFGREAKTGCWPERSVFFWPATDNQQLSIGKALILNTPVVDVWMQHPTSGFLRDPMFASLLRWTRGGDQLADVPVELTIRSFRSAGVRKALVSAWHGPAGPLISNDEVIRIVEADPELFAGVGSVDISRPMEAVREARRVVREHGFRAIRVLPWLWNLPPNHRRYYPVYAACVELGVPLCLQVGHTGPLRPSEPGRPIPYLDDVALEFPELVLVGGHIGFPWTNEMISLATKYPNVHIDTSAYKPSRYPAELVAFMREHGRRKVMFGSNYPMIQPGDCLAQIDALGLDDEARRMFLFENARRVFGVSVD